MNFIFHHLFHRVIAVIVAISIVFQSGCAIIPAPVPKALDTKHRDKLGKIAIIATEQVPEIIIEGLADNILSGAGKGAIAASGPCIEIFKVLAAGGDVIGAYLIYIMLPFCAAIGAAGSIVGAVASPGVKQEIGEAEFTLTKAILAKNIQELFRDQVVTSALANKANLARILPEKRQSAIRANDYSSLAVEGADTVVEITLTKVHTVGDGLFMDTPVRLQMEAHARIIRSKDNTEIFSNDYVYHGPKLKLSDWFANQNEQLLLGLKTGYEALGAHIYESIFLLYSMPGREPALLMSGYYGLLPWVSWENTGENLHPTFMWQGFPRYADFEKEPEEMARVKNVTYDLVVANEKNGEPFEIAYRKTGIEEVVHTMERPLKPASLYFWSVRARFELDGCQRVTEWSLQYRGKEKAVWTAPSKWSFHFKTPDNQSSLQNNID